MQLLIYHHPRCSKSRKTLELIESRGIRPQIIDYLAEPPDPDTLLDIAGMLDMPLADLLRDGEPEVKEAGSSLPREDDAALAQWLHDHPKALQRPIVVDRECHRAVLGRPPENVLDLIGS